MKKILICIVAALLCVTAQSKSTQSTDLRGDAIAIWEAAVSKRASAPVKTRNGLPKDSKTEHTRNYKPYVIISTQLNKQMTGEELEERVFCRTDDEAMSNVMEIIKTYDVIKPEKQVQEGFVTLRGMLKDGKPVEVFLIASPHLPDETRDGGRDYKNLHVIYISISSLGTVSSC